MENFIFFAVFVMWEYNIGNIVLFDPKTIINH